MDYTTAVIKAEVLTIRIDKELNKKLSVVTENRGIARAHYKWVFLKSPSAVDIKELIGAWESELKRHIFHP